MKPKPKYDQKTGKWVVMNWDGSVAGVENGDQRSFQNLSNENTTTTSSSLSPNNTSTGNNSQQQNQSRQPQSSTSNFTIPFAKINEVAVGSPAKEAGLCEGDLILEFGPINYTNHNNLRALMEVVTTAADSHQEIKIIIQRGTNTTQVGLTPKPWLGRGLIGCHILPYSAGE